MINSFKRLVVITIKLIELISAVITIYCYIVKY